MDFLISQMGLSENNCTADMGVQTSESTMLMTKNCVRRKIIALFILFKWENEENVNKTE